MSSFKIIRLSGNLLNYVNGQRLQPTGSTPFSVVEPATDNITGCEALKGNESGQTDVNAAIAAARAAFPIWSSLSGLERGKILRKTAQLIRVHLEDIALEEVKYNGKGISEAKGDIEACADTFEYYAGLAPTVHGTHIPLNGDIDFAYTRREPFGVIGGIGAWNFPFQTATWKMAPALACGNTFVYKPSPWAPVTPIYLAEILTASGLPQGAVNIVQGGAETGETLCFHEGVDKASFTGSVPTGQKIMRNCATNGLKPVTLELGGKSPLIIFEDADVDRAVVGAMVANFLTQGENCSDGTRVFVHKSLYKQFLNKFVDRVKKLKVGDPLEADTKIGATITEQHMKRVLAYVESAKEEGAQIECGGERVTVAGRCKDGYFISPCVVSNVHDNMKIVREEIFGAVAAVLPFSDEDEAVRRANDTNYGLGAGLFTNNLQRAHRVAKQLQAGIVWINCYNLNPVEVAFGGYKHSGIGRELGREALDFYTQVKSVMMDNNEQLEDPFL